MQDWQEKLKNALLLSDDDVALVLKGDFKNLFAQNKNGAIRVCSAYGACLALLLIYIALFSFFGGIMKLLVAFVAFGSLAGLGFVIGKENIIKATHIKSFSYFALFMFALWTLFMVSDVMTFGSGWSVFLFFLICIGLGAGIYFIYTKMPQRFNEIQIALATLMLTTVLFSCQVAFIEIQTQSEQEYARMTLEHSRTKSAEDMRKNSMSSSQKICTTEEECNRMNVKKNEYYAKYESDATEACESSIAKEITSRFEWTVSPKMSKFTGYQVDALTDTLTLTGNLAQLIDNDGTKRPIEYLCRYNTKTRVIQAVVK